MTPRSQTLLRTSGVVVGGLWCPWAVAVADDPVEPVVHDTPQGGVELVEQLYARLDLPPNEPAHPRWRRRSSGNYRVFARPDGTVERAFEESYRRVQTEYLFDLHGVLSVTVGFVDEAPAELTVHLAEPQRYELSTWVPLEAHGATGLAPAPAVDGRWPLASGTLWTWIDERAPVFDDAFRDDVVAGCACTLVERRATWIDGEPGVRLRLAHPDDPRRHFTVWAVPRGDRTWLAAVEVRADDPDVALAEARALVATLRWDPVEDDGS